MAVRKHNTTQWERDRGTAPVQSVTTLTGLYLGQAIEGIGRRIKLILLLLSRRRGRPDEPAAVLPDSSSHCPWR